MAVIALEIMNGTRSETLLVQTRMHWGIFVPALLSMILLAAALSPILILFHFVQNILSQLKSPSIIFDGGLPYLIVFLPPILIGLPLLLLTLVAYLKSEIRLTNRRLLFRTGLASKTAGELPLENVDAIIINEPLLGRILGYGTVIVTSVGGLHFPLRYISSPQNFHATLQRAVREAKDRTVPVSKPVTSVPDDDSRYMPKR